MGPETRPWSLQPMQGLSVFQLDGLVTSASMGILVRTTEARKGSWEGKPKALVLLWAQPCNNIMLPQFALEP